MQLATDRNILWRIAYVIADTIDYLLCDCKKDKVILTASDGVQYWRWFCHHRNAWIFQGV